MNKLLTYKQVQEILGVSRSTVFKLSRQGKLTYIREHEGQRGATRFPQESVEAYIAKRTHKGRV